jgi:putative transposase
MAAPALAVGDGALGFWKTVREVFPVTRGQRCQLLKLSNVFAALSKSAHPGALAALKFVCGVRRTRAGILAYADTA